MAKIVQAVNVYGPKLELNPTAQLNQVAQWAAMRTGLNKSEVMMLLQELNEAILYYATSGTPVKLPGVGMFKPSIDRRGTFKVNYRADQALKNGINAPGAYIGPVRNRSLIDLTDQEYKAFWDADHPDDPLEI